MNSNTKFSRLISELVIRSRKKLWVFKNIVTVSIFTLFFGFVCGNLFGTFLNYFRNFVQWDGLIISLTILIIEFINYLNFCFTKASLKTLNYDNQSLQPVQDKLIEQTKNFTRDSILITKRRLSGKLSLLNKRYWVKILNFYKIGLLLGFFIDAFKVGS